ncbi:kinase-like domain-containing protein [Kalaharituber pfeilii]|nr:kinase-like domain-containing protein [Kalaharituber pfeilii]
MTQTSRIKWAGDIFGNVQPTWVIEPSVSELSTLLTPYLSQLVDAQGPIQVRTLAQGVINKAYTAAVGDKAYVARVTLPIDPGSKTLSEVATLQYLRKHTKIPAPEVFAWNADECNSLGYEWILMGKIEGLPLSKVWAAGVSWESRIRVVEEVAEAIGELWNLRFPSIGSLYKKDEKYEVGRIMSMEYFWGERLTYNIDRGPFTSSYDWMMCRCNLMLAEAVRNFDNSETENSKEVASRTRSLIQGLIAILPTFFSRDMVDEKFSLSHTDMSGSNVLLSPQGTLAALIDWEFTAALPLWASCKMPKFLISNERVEKPDVKEYARNGDGTVNKLYFEHLEEWKKTELRGFFIEKMKLIGPEWFEEWCSESGIRKRAFEWAMRRCNGEIYQQRIKDWLDGQNQEN